MGTQGDAISCLKQPLHLHKFSLEWPLDHHYFGKFLVENSLISQGWLSNLVENFSFNRPVAYTYMYTPPIPHGDIVIGIHGNVSTSMCPNMYIQTSTLLSILPGPAAVAKVNMVATCT